MVHEFLHQEITCKTILDYLGYGKLDLTLFDVIGELRKTMARERERGKGFKVVGDGCLTFAQSIEDEEPTANTT